MDKIHFDQLLVFAVKVIVFIGILIFVKSFAKKRYLNKYESAIDSIDKGNYTKALKFLNTHIQNVPEDFNALALRGECLYLTDKWEEARKDFIKATSLNPECSKSQYFLGQIEVRSGNHDTALFHFNRAVEIQPANAVFVSQRAVLHFYMSNFLESKTDYLNAIRLLPDKKALFLPYLAFCYYQLDDYELANVTFEDAIKLNRNDPQIYKFRGIMFFQLMKFNESIADLESAIVLEDDLRAELVPLINQARAKMN